jgi:hypothetical protein
MGSLSGARVGALIVVCALALASCGGGGDDESSTTAEPTTYTAENVVAAFQEAAGGYPFDAAESLIPDAVTYAPKNSSDPAAVAPLNEALGDASVLWQVAIFEGDDPPLDQAAVEEVGSASEELDEAAPGVFIGDNDIAYAANGNVVIFGPALDGDPEDPTVVGWKGVLDGL